MNAAASAWTFTSTKYVKTIAIAQGTGVITVTYDTSATGISQLSALGSPTILLQPFVNKVALADSTPGNVDWGCSSATETTEVGNGLAAMTKGSMPAKYVPTQCK